MKDKREFDESVLTALSINSGIDPKLLIRIAENLEDLERDRGD